MMIFIIDIDMLLVFWIITILAEISPSFYGYSEDNVCIEEEMIR